MNRNAQLSNKPVYFYNSTSGEIMNGLPEEFPAPFGYQKIVCTSAHEAEIWSERQRKYENFKHSLQQEERGMIEGRIRDELRSHLLHLMANARNNLNRDFLKAALAKMDAKPDPWRMKRESYLHAEAFENGR